MGFNIHVAAIVGDVQAVAALVQEDTSLLLTTGGVDGVTPMHMAAMNGQTQLVRWLAQHPRAPDFVNAVDSENGQTALHFAALNGKAPVVGELLRVPEVDLKCIDDNKRTPFHLASMNGHANIISQFLTGSKEGQNMYWLTASDRHGHTALHLAARYGHAKIVRLLLEHLEADQAKVCVTCKDKMGWTPVHFAVITGSTDVVEELLTSCKDMDVFKQKSKRGWEPLHIASMLGHAEIVELMCGNVSIDINSTTENLERFTPLHLAANNGHDLVIDALLRRRDLLFDKHDALQRTALHYAARQGHASVVRKLLESESGLLVVDATDASGLTALHLAAREGHAKVVHILVEGGADVNAKAGSSTVSKSLLELASNHDQPNEPLVDPMVLEADCGCTDQMTPLHLAARNGHMVVVTQLLKHPTIEVCSMDGHGLMPQDWADVRSVKKQFVDCLEAENLQCQTSKVPEQKLQALREDMVKCEKLVAKMRCKQLIMRQGSNYSFEFLQHIAKAYDDHNKEGMGLHYAARKGDYEMVESLLQFAISDANEKHGVHDVNDQDEVTGNTPLHLAAKHGHKRVVEVLMKCSMTKAVNVKNQDGYTPLALAFWGNHVEICKIILQHHGNVEDDLHEFLRSAIRNRWLDMATLLVGDSRTPATGNGGSRSLVKEAVHTKDDCYVNMLLRRATIKERLMQERKEYLDSASAVLVTAALIASVTYSGWLQPPQGKHQWARTLFDWFNAASFYSAVATIIAASAGSLPIRHMPELLETTAHTRMSGKLSGVLLIMSTACVLWAFATAGFTAAWGKKPLVSVLSLGAGATMLFLLWFLKRYLKLYDSLYITNLQHERRLCAGVPSCIDIPTLLNKVEGLKQKLQTFVSTREKTELQHELLQFEKECFEASSRHVNESIC